MSSNGSLVAVERITINGMIGALTKKLTAVATQVRNQLRPLHSIVKRSRKTVFPAYSLLNDSLFVSMRSRNASNRLAFTSSTVLP